MTSDISTAIPPPEYVELHDGAGLVRLDSVGQIEMTGVDAASFLNRMCTNQVERLAAGSGVETFLTDAKGHILVYLLVFQRPQSLVLRLVGGEAATVVEHLDRYIIRAKVELHDRSAQWGEFLLAGRKAEEVLATLASVPLPKLPLAHVETEAVGTVLSIRRLELGGPAAFLLSAGVEAVPFVEQALEQAGARRCGPEAAEALRIEAGWPCFGRDISAENLPQEVGRDALTISYHKGCYLGQETVARIESRGHVNKLLAGLRFAGPAVPPPGTELSAAGKPAGRITSATFSPHFAAALALGYVARGQHAAGSRLDSAFGPAEVVALPC
jgi:folate-binding protein YgfZ